MNNKCTIQKICTRSVNITTANKLKTRRKVLKCLILNIVQAMDNVQHVLVQSIPILQLGFELMTIGAQALNTELQ
jgi:hypothetical protein